MCIRDRFKDSVKALREKFEFSEDVVMSALKKAEDTDDVVVRFYEPFGKRARFKFKVDAEITNILEDTVNSINSGEEISFRPFEIKTLKFKK